VKLTAVITSHFYLFSLKSSREAAALSTMIGLMRTKKTAKLINTTFLTQCLHCAGVRQ
jgi:hypothetical protein